MTATNPQVPVKALLRVPKLWLMPTLLSTLLTVVLSLVYMGGVVNPMGNLDRLPIAVVNADQGQPLPGQQQNLGTQITQSLTAGTSHAVDWRVLTQAQAQDQMDSGKVYGELSIPADFTNSVAALVTNTATARPTLTVLTNPGTGSLGSSFAQTISTQAAQQASMTLGSQLAAAAGPDADAAAKLLLADPVHITIQPGHPLGQHSGLGLTAFYYALVIVMMSFLAANVIQSGVDSGLGYADTEIGPWHRRRPTVPINRTRTLLLKMAMTAALTAVTVTLLMVSTIGILGIDASHLPLLWIFSYCAALAVALGALAIYAAFGGIGQLVAMVVFVVMGLPSSGLTIPLQAVPGFYRFLSRFEPMHQLAGGVRSILYFDARGDAGLTHAWIMIAIGLILALVFGFAMTRYYDRKGLRRLVPQPAPPATPDVQS
ncbi:MAG: transporter [Nocardia sp.]|nr:transporter [Nocardia sp.]